MAANRQRSHPAQLLGAFDYFSCPFFFFIGIGDGRLCSSVRSGAAYDHSDQIGLVQGQ